MRKGFSLVEILVVLAVLGILAVFILPNLLGASHQADLNGITQQIVASAREAQTQAADQMKGAQWGIHYENATNTAPFYAVFYGTSYATGTIENRYALPATVGYVTSTLPVGSWKDITFNPVSGAASASATIKLYVITQPAISSTIVIGTAGQVGIGASPTVTPSTTVQNVWVVDAGNDRIQEFSMSGAFLSQFGSYGAGNGQFSFPEAMAIGSNGNIWVADSVASRVQEFDAAGHYLNKFGSYGTGNGQFSGMYGITVDSSGNVWVPDRSGGRVEEFNASGTYIGQIGGCSSGYCSSGSGNGQLDGPTALAFDASGNAWVIDFGNDRIEEFTPSNTYLSQFPDVGESGIVFNSQGDMWVAAETVANEYNPSGTLLAQVSCTSGACVAPIGPGHQFNLYMYGLGIDNSDNVWVPDANNNNRVEEFTPSNGFVMQIGCASGACASGTSSGQFYFPTDVVIH